MDSTLTITVILIGTGITLVMVNSEFGVDMAVDIGDESY